MYRLPFVLSPTRKINQEKEMHEETATIENKFPTPAESQFQGVPGPSAKSPLNLPLFESLQRGFGPVQVANPGRPATADASGEYYRADCPYCGDRKFRLWVNYRFNTDDGNKGDNLHLVICYNEGCINSRQKQQQLRDRLFPFSYGFPLSGVGPPATGVLRTAVPAPSTNESDAVWLPPGSPLGDSLAEQGRQYLQARQFDPDEISERYQVEYCSVFLDSSIQLDDCLIIPIESCEPQLGSSEPRFGPAGWQARNLTPSPTEPKYFTMPGMRVKRHLYGLLEAVSGEGPLVVVEGVTDVWRVGPNGVATFGKTMSREQQQLLLRHAGDRPIVVMYDRDAFSEGRSVADSLRQLRRDHQLEGRVVAVPPPDGCEDVGDSTREVAWDQVRRALRNEISSAAWGRAVVAVPEKIVDAPIKSDQKWEIVL